MKNRILLCIFILITHFIKAQNAKIIIKNVNLITMTTNTVQPMKSVLIEGGKIKQIGTFKKLPEDKNTTIVDGKGKYLMPSLADMHVHLGDGNDVDTLLMLSVAAGITHVRVLDADIKYSDLKTRLKSKDYIAPDIHFSTVITRDKNYDKMQLDSLVMAAKADGISILKVKSITDEAQFDNMMQLVTANNMMICGHFPMSVQFGKGVPLDLNKVMKSGYRSIEHLGGYDKLATEKELLEAILLTKAQNVFNCPTLDWDKMAYNQQYPTDYKNRLVFKYAPQKYLDKWEKEYAELINQYGDKAIDGQKQGYAKIYEKKLKIFKQLYDNNCPLLMGGDGGGFFQMNGFNIYDEMQNWSKIGVDNFTILKSTTLTPAQFFKEEKSWGTIEIGKNGDVILLEKNPLENIQNIMSLELTIMKGQIYQKAELMKRL
jgi:predicted amidohydrolase